MNEPRTKFALIDDVAGHVYNPDLPMAPFFEAFQNLKSSFVVERDIVRALPMLFRRLTVTGNPTSPIIGERRAPD
jgi:hypothetical protein